MVAPPMATAVDAADATLLVAAAAAADAVAADKTMPVVVVVVVVDTGAVAEATRSEARKA